MLASIGILLGGGLGVAQLVHADDDPTVTTFEHLDLIEEKQNVEKFWGDQIFFSASKDNANHA